MREKGGEEYEKGRIILELETYVKPTREERDLHRILHLHHQRESFLE